MLKSEEMLIPFFFFIKRLLSPSRAKESSVVWKGTLSSPVLDWVAPKDLVLYEKLLRELNLEERRHFKRLVRECVTERNYPKGETLFQYCYFSTLKYRMDKLWKRERVHTGMGAYIYSQGIKEIEYSMSYYLNLLENGAIPLKGCTSPSSWLEARLKEGCTPVKRLPSPIRSLKG